MSDFLRVNKPRADKILHLFRLIEKSARSYRVEPTDKAELLEEVRRTIGTPEPKHQEAVADTVAAIQREPKVVPCDDPRRFPAWVRTLNEQQRHALAIALCGVFYEGEP